MSVPPPDPALRPPEMTILSDHPILHDQPDEDASRTSPDQPDSFELHTRLAAVFDIIRHKNTRAPLAIGIFGDWGTGKSSAMRWLSTQLTHWSKANDLHGHFKARCVWFEPWKYQTREDVWRGLIAEVVIHSIDVRHASVATVISAAKKFGSFLGRSFIHAVSSLELSGGVPGVGEAAINLESLTKIADDYKQTTHPEKAYLNEFESTLKSWVSNSLGQHERMVLFIDDLDRCLPHVVLEVLEALKLYLNIPQLIFVIGLDRDVVKAIVRKHYRAAELSDAKADSYLDKMFQVEVEVPPSERQMDGYFASQVTALDAATDGFWTKQLNLGGKDWKQIIEKAIRSIAVHNPREVKRLLNSTLIYGTAAARKSTPDENVAKRFGQGCQAYLIARALRDMDGNPAATLRLKDTWTFLQKWSQFIKDYPTYRPDRADRSQPSDFKAPGGRDPAKRTPAQIGREDDVRQLMPRTLDAKKEPFPLWDMSILWDLLTIECSPEVGQSVAISAAEAKPEPLQPPAPAPDTSAVPPAPISPDPINDSAGQLPLVVRSRLAKQVNKDPKSLTPADLASVTLLDLSRSDIDDAGLALLTRPDSPLKALTTLRLGGTKVTDAGLAHLARPDSPLKALTKLDLRATHVTDAGIKKLRARFPNIKMIY